ncbi:adenylate cyclase [Skermanella aerolata]|uniref:CHASE2 domain-containing protein n=1 Tax=Skermanella aerolata TaxID=393310 RepID=UPI003D22138B
MRLPGRWLLLPLAIPLVLALLRLTDAEPAPLQDLEAQTLTLRYRLRGPLEPSGAVSLVMIDDRTLAEYGRWPLSRRLIADAVRRLTADGVAVVAVDLLFAEREHGIPDPDAELAEALAASSRAMVGFAFLFDPERAVSSVPPAALADAAYRVVREPAVAADTGPPDPAGLIAPLETLARAAVPAHVSVLLDPDGQLRHDQTAIRYGDAWFPSLPVEAVRRFLRIDPDDMVLHLGSGVALGPDFVATDSRMRLAVNHYGPPGTVETHSMADLLGGGLAQGTFRDRVVLLGASARGVGDSFATPFSRTLPGAEHLATVIDNLLTGRTPTDRPALVPADTAAILAGGIAATLLGTLLTPILAGLATLVLIAGWTAASAILFATAGLWLTVTSPALAALAGFALSSARRTLIGDRARRLAERQRHNLMRYFSPEIAERLMNTNAPGLDDRVQTCTILFIDLVGFTGVNERLSPNEAMDLLRGFYRLVESAVLDHGGIVDKFMGDGAMAVFGIITPSPDDAADALKAARALASAMDTLNAELEAAGLTTLKIAMGLHIGPVLIGDTGGTRQFTYTVTGDPVNVASRLQHITRELGVVIAASDAVIEAARSSGGGGGAVEGFVELPLTSLRGRERPVGIWGWPAPPAD